MAEARELILVVVHPGSACGSANFNLGRFAARGARDALVREVEDWSASVVIIDGSLSDELPYYPALQQALDGCLRRSAAAGGLAVRVMGDDPEQVDRIREIATAMGERARRAHFVVTGAWLEPKEGGCVGSVVRELRSMGCTAEVARSAVFLDMDEQCSEEDEDTPASVLNERLARSPPGA